MTTRLLYAIGVTAIVACACTTLGDPALDSRAERFDAPTVYSRWWAMTESCSGLRGSLADITWYKVPGSDVVELSGRDVGGYWTPDGNSIVLAGNGVLEGGFVRHEMLHALIRAREGHSRQQFIERCGGIVSCLSACLEDAGTFPTPDATVSRMTADVLDVGMSLIPSVPLESIDGGFFTLVVTARNPKDHPIVVLLAQPWNRTFTYNLFGPAGARGTSETLSDPEFAYFKAGETKQRYFDFNIPAATNSAHTVNPGAYTVIAGYDTRHVTRENVQIGSTSSR